MRVMQTQQATREGATINEPLKTFRVCGIDRTKRGIQYECTAQGRTPVEAVAQYCKEAREFGFKISKIVRISEVTN